MRNGGLGTAAMSTGQNRCSSSGKGQGGSASEGTRYRSGDGEFGDRRDRGAYPRVPVSPLRTSRSNRTGKHSYVLKATDLKKPGRYRVLCRVTDPAKLRGDRYPWVLSDPHHLLQSERGWWVDYRQKRKKK